MTPDNMASSKLATEYLLNILPNGPWCVTAFDPNGGRGNGRTEVFLPRQETALLSFIEEHNGTRNLHYQLNAVKPRAEWQGSGRPKKEDFFLACGLHVDIDFNTLQDRRVQNDIILDNLVERPVRGVPLPTHVVMSGNGYQAIWLFEKPTPLDDARAIEAIENINRTLQIKLQGDAACIDIGHLLRLPHTVNIPTQKKKEKGYTVVDSFLVTALNGPRYAPSDIQLLEKGQIATSLPKKKKHHVAVANFGDLPRLTDLADLDQYNVPDRVKAVILQGPLKEEPKAEDNSRSAWVFDVCCNLLRCRVPERVIAGILTDPAWCISESVLELGRGAQRYIEHCLSNASEKVAADVANPADVLIASFPSRVLRYGKQFYRYDENRYIELEDEEMDRCAYALWPGIGSGDLTNVIREVRAKLLVPKHKGVPPLWLDGTNLDVIPVRNGLVDVNTGELHPPTDNLFNLNRLDVVYDQNAGEPKLFNEFIRRTMHDDSHDTAHDIIADIIKPDLERHYIFGFLGGGGTGKSTLAKIVNALVGLENVGNQGIRELSGTFGLQVYIGKMLAVFQDIDISSRDVAMGTIVSRLKAMSGNDDLSAARKGTTHFEHGIRVRCVMFGNGLPKLTDPSGALQERYRLIAMANKFRGTAAEDKSLAERIIAEELPAILLQAIKRRRTLGPIATPPSALHWLAHANDAEDRFLEDWCEVGLGFTVSKDALYSEYLTWHREYSGEQSKPLSKADFTAKLTSKLDGRVALYRPKNEARQSLPWQWTGIRLSAAAEEQARAAREDYWSKVPM